MSNDPLCLVAQTHQKLKNTRIANVEADTLAHLNSLTTTFQQFFSDRQYEIEDPVRITENLDHTVRFIGAPISVLKPYFMEHRIPSPGIAMVQNCIRTRNLQSLLDIEHMPKYGSFFTGMCVLVPYGGLSQLCADFIEFLTDNLGITFDEIKINISRADADLHSAISTHVPNDTLCFDTEPKNYYRHKYGIEGVWGRNFNIALSNVKSGKFEDIGNIIVIENNTEQLGVELAIGDTTMMQLLLGYDHILDCYNIDALPLEATDPIRRKLEDVMIACLALYREGLRPKGASTQARILRTYMKALSMYRQVSGLPFESLEEILREVELKKVPFDCKSKYDEIILWIEEYEASKLNPALNNEDAIIYATIEKASHPVT